MMTARDVVGEETDFLLETDTVVLAAQKLRDTGLPSLPVLDGESALRGQLGAHDVTTCVAAGADPAHTHVCEYAGERGLTVEADEPLVAVLRTMADHRVQRLPVLDGDRFLGTVTYAAVYEISLAAADGDPRIVGTVQS